MFFTLVTIMKVYIKKLPKKKLCKHQNLPIITKYESFYTIQIMVTIRAKTPLSRTTRNVTLDFLRPIKLWKIVGNT
jgi:hypothetical protein